MMDHQPLPLAYMQQCGSALLRALQNQSMVLYDLVVREAIQNSLDAATPGATSVAVDIDIREHTTESVARALHGDVSDELRKRHRTTNRLIEIRDRNTVGLTGPLRLEELAGSQSHGNLLKLVYEIGRSQEREDAGGSWGLGKTVYFRAGIGLVFYYSRIHLANGTYEERAAACFVEDERAPERVQNSQTGICWWGAGATGPVTDSAKVRDVLASLGVKPYSGAETGTVVVVPFLRSDLRPKEGGGDDGSPTPERSSQPWWNQTDEDYIRVAVQRWYAVRIDNPSFTGGPWLNARVCGRHVTTKEMLPAFQVAQGLYNRANGVPRDDADYLGQLGKEVVVRVEEVSPVQSAAQGTTVIGKVAFVTLSPGQLGMGAPSHQPSPFSAIYGADSAPPNLPIVGFVRSHGMVVRWDSRADGRGWTKGVPPLEEYLLAVFVPDGARALHPTLLRTIKRNGGTVDSYLRGCEKADHHQWTDPQGATVVERIRKRVAERISAFVRPEAPPVVPVEPLLAARALADCLLPMGFGKDGRGGGTGKPAEVRNPRPRGSLPALMIRGMRYAGPLVRVQWELRWPKKAQTCMLHVLVDTEAGALPRDLWLSRGIGSFPLSIENAVMSGGDSARSCQIVESGSAVLLRDEGQQAESVGGIVVAGELAIRIQHPAGSAIHPVLAVALSSVDASGGRK